MTDNAVNFNLVQPTSSNTADGQSGDFNSGKQNEQLIAQIHGSYYYAGARGNLFSFNVTAVTVPVIAATLASVFSLYNPVSSGKVLELVDFDQGLLSGTTVINVLGLYWQGSPAADKATFTTPGIFGTHYFGASPSRGVASGIPYRALTHSGTPVRIAILNSQNTTTDTQGTPVHYDFNGKIVLYPGDVVSVAASTAAMTSTSTDLSIRWAEWALPS